MLIFNRNATILWELAIQDILMFLDSKNNFNIKFKDLIKR